MTKLTFDVRPLSEILEPDGLSGLGSLVDQVYELLRKRIVDLSLPPESALVEQEVAGTLKVSKTPVREAIIRLSREGLVQVVPKSGSYVTAVSLDRYLEACFVRTQLEVGCVRRLATQGVSLADQIKLRALLTEQEAAIKHNDDGRFVELDEALHKRLFELAGLSGTWEVLNFAKAELDRVRFIKRQSGIRQRQLVLDEHTAFVDAVINRDPDAAEQAMRNNIGAVDEEMVSISENPRLLRTIDDLNQLVALDRRTRGSKKAVKG